MANYIDLVAGAFQRVAATVISLGAPSAGTILALDASGKIDSSVLPTGVGAETLAVTASEALTAGSMVNIVGATCRLADNSNGRRADGFVLAAVANAAVAQVYITGVNTAVTTPLGEVFLGTAGAVIAAGALPTAAGTIVQRVGTVTATGLAFDGDPAVKN